MYGGDAMDTTKSSVDPYADPPSSAIDVDSAVPAKASNGTNGNGVHGGRDRSRSRSRSPRRDRSPRRISPPYQRRRSPPPPRRPPHAPQAPTPSQVLGVFGLSIRTVERQLDEEFSRYGTVEKVTIVYDARTGRSRGFGFIKMAATEEASACIEKLNGIEIDGRRLRVDYSVTERPHQPTPGEYMGHRRETDSYRGGGSRNYDYDRRDTRDRDRDRDRDYYSSSRHNRDRGDRDRDRDRDNYGRDRDRDRDWRDRRSPSPPPRRRRSGSRSPAPRASGSAKDEGDRGAPRW